METRKHGNAKTRKHGNMEKTWKRGNMKIWKHGNIENIYLQFTRAGEKRFTLPIPAVMSFQLLSKTMCSETQCHSY